MGITKRREDIILEMCYTWRHDYDLDKKEHDGPGGYISVGLTEDERKSLWRNMEQLFDNCINPHMEFKTDTNDNWVEP
jgi:hypothetical protein